MQLPMFPLRKAGIRKGSCHPGLMCLSAGIYRDAGDWQKAARSEITTSQAQYPYDLVVLLCRQMSRLRILQTLYLF